MASKFALIVAGMLMLSDFVSGQITGTGRSGHQTRPTTLPARPDQEASPPAQLEGLWPSRKLMNLMLARWADRVSREYELDEAQSAKVREAVVECWTGFLNENRPTIQPLANGFLEMRLALGPPKKERVQAWAQRATPVFEQFRERLDQSTAEFREILNPLQRARFDVEALQIGVGMDVAERKLKQWQKGDFDIKEFWEPAPENRRERREERRRRAKREQAADFNAPGATGGLSASASTVSPADEADQITLELTAWETYVEGFVRIYRLDEGQRTAVLSCHTELKQRALAHRDSRRDEITKLELRIQNFTGSDQELTVLKKQLTELYGPIDDMFQELKRRIEQIPTAKQRAAAASNSE